MLGAALRFVFPATTQEWRVVNALHSCLMIAACSFFVGCTNGSTQEREVTVRCRTREPGKMAYVLEWKFEAVRKAIVDEALSHPEGILKRDLTDAVMRRIPESERTEIPKPAWLIDVVASELQARKAIAITKKDNGYFVTLSPDS